MAQKICCPQCGNEELQVINETNVQTTGKNYSAGKGCLGYLLLGPFGLLCGSCGQGQKTHTTNTTYWVCPKCGEKFRNPNDLRKDAHKYKYGVITFSVLFLLWLVVTAWIAGMDAPSDAISFMIIFGVVFMGGLAALCFYRSKKSAKEANELESAMAERLREKEAKQISDENK